MNRRWMKMAACAMVALWASLLLEAQAEDRALLIGVSEYSDTAIKSLPGVATDLENMYAFVVGPLGYRPEQVKRLKNAEANKETILRSIDDWLLESTEPGDRALLYFAGHGVQVADQTGGDEIDDGRDEAVVPADAACARRKRMSDGTYECLDELQNVVLDDELNAALSRLADRNVTVILDSCHAGTATRGTGQQYPPRSARTPTLALETQSAAALTRSGSLGRNIALVDAEQGRVVWSAVSPGQYALEDANGSKPAGVFTTLFIKGLTSKSADQNHNGDITHAEFIDWLRSESQAYCNQDRDCMRRGLTPMLEAEPRVLAEPLTTTLLPASNSTPALESPASAIDNALASGSSSPDMRVSVRIVDARPAAGGPAAALSGPFRHGQLVRFEVQSSFPGELILMEVHPDYSIRQLFPHPSMSCGVRDPCPVRVLPDRPRVFPDRGFMGALSVQLEGKVGERSRLIAVVTSDPVDLSDITGPVVKRARNIAIVGPEGAADASPGGDAIPAGAVIDYVTAIAQRLRAPWQGAEGTRPARWAIATQDYTIGSAP